MAALTASTLPRNGSVVLRSVTKGYVGVQLPMKYKTYDRNIQLLSNTPTSGTSVEWMEEITLEAVSTYCVAFYRKATVDKEMILNPNLLQGMLA